MACGSRQAPGEHALQALQHSCFPIGFVTKPLTFQTGSLLQEWGLDVTKSSFLSGLPWALSFALANLAGWSADSLINKKLLSITNTRKLMQGIASLGPATCLTFLAMQKSGPGHKPTANADISRTIINES